MYGQAALHRNRGIFQRSLLLLLLLLLLAAAITAYIVSPALPSLAWPCSWLSMLVCVELHPAWHLIMCVCMGMLGCVGPQLRKKPGAVGAAAAPLGIQEKRKGGGDKAVQAVIADSCSAAAGKADDHL